jgi:hypothetical protein
VDRVPSDAIHDNSGPCQTKVRDPVLSSGPFKRHCCPLVDLESDAKAFNFDKEMVVVFLSNGAQVQKVVIFGWLPTRPKADQNRDPTMYRRKLLILLVGGLILGHLFTFRTIFRFGGGLTLRRPTPPFGAGFGPGGSGTGGDSGGPGHLGGVIRLVLIALKTFVFFCRLIVGACPGPASSLKPGGGTGDVLS